jgi:hypothetical protein
MVGGLDILQHIGEKSKMEMKRNIDWSKVLLAFLITVFLFNVGVLLGYFGSKIIEGSSISIIQSTNNEISNLETLNLLEQNYPCSSSTLDVATERLAYMSDLIDSMEDQRGKTNSDVIELKKIYSIVEIRHMLLLKQRAENCGVNYSIVIYFYSNENECKDDTNRISFILTYLRNKFSNLRVYSYDINLNNDAVQILKNYYNATGCYQVLLDEKPLGEIRESQDIEKYL